MIVLSFWKKDVYGKLQQRQQFLLCLFLDLYLFNLIHFNYLFKCSHWLINVFVMLLMTFCSLSLSSVTFSGHCGLIPLTLRPQWQEAAPQPSAVSCYLQSHSESAISVDYQTDSGAISLGSEWELHAVCDNTVIKCDKLPEICCHL